MCEALSGRAADASVSPDCFVHGLNQLRDELGDVGMPALRTTFKQYWPATLDFLHDGVSIDKVRCLLGALFDCGPALVALCKMETFLSQHRREYMDMAALLVQAGPSRRCWEKARAMANKNGDEDLVHYLDQHEPCELCGKPAASGIDAKENWIGQRCFCRAMPCARPSPQGRGHDGPHSLLCILSSAPACVLFQPVNIFTVLTEKSTGSICGQYVQGLRCGAVLC